MMPGITFRVKNKFHAASENYNSMSHVVRVSSVGTRSVRCCSPRKAVLITRYSAALDLVFSVYLKGLLKDLGETLLV